MAKKRIQVIKFRFWAVGISAAILLAGIVAFFLFGGFSTGIDFESGLSQRIQIAPAGLEVSYTGTSDVTLSVSGDSLQLEVRDANGVQNYAYSATKYPTAGALAAAMDAVEGVTAKALDASLKSSSLVAGFGFPATLTAIPTRLNFNTAAGLATIEQVRSALSSLGNVKVQTVGLPANSVFQVRLGTAAGDTQESMETAISNALANKFGNDKIVLLQSDFVGPKFSQTLISSSLIAILVAMVLILIYIWFRFRIAYAVSALVALVHDVLLLLAFIVIFQFEISSTTVAAVLTIIGYSLNNTIVIFDRIRENVKLNPDTGIGLLVDSSVTQSMSRTMISSITTVLAVLPLVFFTTGDIRFFALNLIIGIIIGTYSSNFIAPALLFWITKSHNKHHPAAIEELREQGIDGNDTTLVAGPAAVEIPTAERKLKGKRRQTTKK